jgi:hypothetical protein
MANQYSIAAIGPLAATTAAKSMHGQLHAFLKNSKSLKYCVPNEYICAEIGRFLGLPVPPCGLCYLRGHDPEHWFASLNFNLSAATLPPVDPIKCVQELPSESTGLILFDILIANDDRHRNNLNMDTSHSPAKISVFDHSHAFFGPVDGKETERLEASRDKLRIDRGARHCLLDSISSDTFFSEWIERIKVLPNYLIEQVCEATVPLGMITKEEAEVAKKFLKYRKERVKNNLKDNQKEFKAISSWSLI